MPRARVFLEAAALLVCGALLTVAVSVAVRGWRDETRRHETFMSTLDSIMRPDPRIAQLRFDAHRGDSLDALNDSLLREIEATSRELVRTVDSLVAASRVRR